MPLLVRTSRFLHVQISFYSKSRVSKAHLNNILKTMPKEPTHVAERQIHRNRIKERMSKYVPGKVSLQVLGTGAPGAPRSLYVFTDQSRYLFNCGEGTQRLAHEHKMKLAKLEHIFITYPIWKNIGGLPGTALTIQDVGVPQITLHGPKGIEELFAATKRFVVIRDLQVKVTECDDQAEFQDNVMNVKYIPLVPNARKLNTTGFKEEGPSMAFVCRLNPRPGALNLDACVAKGVPAGPLLGKLKSGEDVTLPNGDLIKSQDVCYPDEPGPVFIVVECPTVDYLQSMLENGEFQKYQKTAKSDQDAACLVVHFTPQDVVDTESYRNWMDKFLPSTDHLIINEANKCMGSASVHRIQHKLNLLSNDLFPLLGDDGTSVSNDMNTDTPNKKIRLSSEDATPSSEIKNSIDCDNLKVIPASTFTTYHLRPFSKLDRSMELKLCPSDYINETINLEGFPEALQSVKEKLSSTVLGNINEYPKILFLGTGSCIPNKTRNTSGILFQLTPTKNILVDCGEGTCGQIIRFFGPKYQNVLLNTKSVYVSHLHADHHLGFIGFILERQQAARHLNINDFEPVSLLAPRTILPWLNFYDKNFQRISHLYKLIPNEDLLFNDTKKCDKELLDSLNLSDIATCHVRHCPNAFGVAFTLENGRKITYSGDTMPSDNLVNLGTNSDLLIHEATMEDELIEEAVQKMHSTTSQAIEVSQKMHARYVLLTHFSQRYAKLPRFNSNFSENVGIAFDNMIVRLDEVPTISYLYPALKIMFAEHYEELENKAEKRKLKQLRIENLKTQIVQNKN